MCAKKFDTHKNRLAHILHWSMCAKIVPTCYVVHTEKFPWRCRKGVYKNLARITHGTETWTDGRGWETVADLNNQKTGRGLVLLHSDVVTKCTNITRFYFHLMMLICRVHVYQRHKSASMSNYKLLFILIFGLTRPRPVF